MMRSVIGVYSLNNAARPLIPTKRKESLLAESRLPKASRISRNSNTSRGHLCILSQKYFPIASVDREKSENHYINIYFMHFALKGKVLKSN